MTKFTLEQIKAMSPADLQKVMNEMAAKNTRKVSFKVTAKKPDGSGTEGALSVYGIHSRFPITVWAAQWETLLDNADALRKFIADNSDKLVRRA